VLVDCESQLLSILNKEEIDTFHCLLFHPKQRIRSRYREITKTRDNSSSNAEEDHIKTVLNKCGLAFEILSDSSQSIGFERKLCTFCDTEASITCIFDSVPDDSNDTYANSNATTKGMLRRERLENELEVMKEIEFKDVDRNVVRLLAFNQCLPKFYIKERLLGDNLQRRLLDARDNKTVIPIADLIGIIIQAVQAIIYVHSYGCLVRDITTASFGCTTGDNGYFIKLKNFEMAAKPSDFPSGGIVSGIIGKNSIKFT
jgi:serine/threonine protein kinase